MKLRFANDASKDSLIDRIEVQIFSQEGAPYCEFTPKWKLEQEAKVEEGKPSGYAMSDCGYAESYPTFLSDPSSFQICN